ncbi:hypothetical protein ACFLQV_01545, partial [Calditrichota bacterium]
MKAINKFIPVIVAILLMPEISIADPEIEFMQIYGNMVSQDFKDIYQNSDGTYIMCGSARPSWLSQNCNGYVVKVDENGEELWTFIEDVYSGYNSIIELDNGNYAVGGALSGWESLITVLTEDGEISWQETYDSSACYAIIELKDGDLAIAGKTAGDGDGSGGDAFIARISAEDGAVRWWSVLDNYYNSIFYGLREFDNFLVGGGDFYNSFPFRQSFLLGKFDQEDGDEVWHNTYNFSGHYDASKGMISHPNGFLIFGRYGTREDIKPGLTLMADVDGDEIWHETYYCHDEDMSMSWSGACTLHNGVILHVGNSGWNSSEPTWNLTDENGEELWFQMYNTSDFGDFLEHYGWFRNVVNTNDGGAIACGKIVSSDTIHYAWIVKLEPFILDLTFVRHTPEDTSLFVLQDDTLRLSAFAKDMFGDAESYLWLRNFSDTLSTDTTVLVEFPELGVDTISCTAVREDKSVTMRWLVNVTEMYIESYTPDTLDLQLRRGTTVDFDLNVRTSHPEDVEYQWTLSDQLDNVQVISDSASAIYTFNYSMWYT